MTRFPRRLSAALLLVLAVGVSAGCTGGGSDSVSESAAGPAPTDAVVETAVPPTSPARPDEDTVRIARSTVLLPVHEAPADDAPVLTELAPTTSFGSPRALLVLDDED